MPQNQVLPPLGGISSAIEHRGVGRRVEIAHVGVPDRLAGAERADRIAFLVEHVGHDIDVGIARRADAAALLVGRRIELAEAAAEGQQVVVARASGRAAGSPNGRCQARSTAAKSASLRRRGRRRESPRRPPGVSGRTVTAMSLPPSLAAMIDLLARPIKRPASSASQLDELVGDGGRDRSGEAGIGRPGHGLEIVADRRDDQRLARACRALPARRSAAGCRPSARPGGRRRHAAAGRPRRACDSACGRIEGERALAGTARHRAERPAAARAARRPARGRSSRIAAMTRSASRQECGRVAVDLRAHDLAQRPAGCRGQHQAVRAHCLCPSLGRRRAPAGRPRCGRAAPWHRA